MPTSRPRKSRKRTREIREQSRATGTRYTEAMRTNDRARVCGEQSPPRLIPTRTLLHWRRAVIRKGAAFP